MVTPADNHSETSTAAAGVNPSERAPRQRPFAFFKRVFRGDRLRLDERQRFYLLLTIFNIMLVFIMVLLSLRQRLTQEVRWLEVTVTRVVVEWLACETESAEHEVMLSRTPTFTPALAPSPTSPLRSPSLSPTASSTAMPRPTVPSPTAQSTTETPIPTATSTCTPMPTPTTQLPTEPRPSDTPAPTYTPTPTDTSTPTATPTFTPTPIPPPDIYSITPNQGVNITPVAVTITGANFFGMPTATLGAGILIRISAATTDTLTGTVPAGLAPGVYALRVTNPDGQFDILSPAYIVLSPPSPDTTLASSYLVTYGSDGLPGDGDNDHVQLVFFDMPDTLTGPLYIRVYDPDTSDALDQSRGVWDTVVRFTVYGGPGAYSDPAARLPQPTAGVTSGNEISTVVFSAGGGWIPTWYTFGPLEPTTQAEHINGHYVFKLAVVGESGDDGNLYNVALSTQPGANIAPAGARIFAFSWTFVLTNTDRPRLHPYVGSGVTTFTQNNFDFDWDSGTISICTPGPELVVLGQDISRDAIAFTSFVSSSFVQGTDYAMTYTGASWAVDFTPFTFTTSLPYNDVTFWGTDQNGTALAIFTRPEIEPPP
jgi:hypothetical protein